MWGSNLELKRNDGNHSGNSWSAIVPREDDQMIMTMIRLSWGWSDDYRDDQNKWSWFKGWSPMTRGIMGKITITFWIWFFCAADRYIWCGFLLYISTMYIHWRRISEHDAGRLWWWWWWWWWLKERNSCFGFLSIRLQQVSLAQQGIFFQPIHKIISHLNWCVIVFDIFSVFQ